MHALLEQRRVSRSVALIAVDRKVLGKVLGRLGKDAQRWVQASAFSAKPGTYCLLPDAQSQLGCVLVGISRADDIYALAALPQHLPQGSYRLSDEGLQLDPVSAAFGWGAGAYQFRRYRKGTRDCAGLAVSAATMRAVAPLLDAVCRVRDLVNTPTEDLGPAQLAAEVRQLAAAHAGKYREWVGVQLLKANFPMIHAVGRASHRAPRLAQLTWGKARHPHVVIVGKGVCFDSGGLDLKSGDGMRWMKKDMGGAAHAIALAELVMRARLPIRLTLLVPAVENAIGANAYRPGEVITARSGITVEIDNTDAEGRLILGDALAYGAEGKPDLLLDFATLTGAARVALGPELPALFANDDQMAEAVLAAGRVDQDPLWRLPLWQPYSNMLDSHVADMVNAGSSRLAGAITAGLYLERFVPDSVRWLHLDLYAWNDGDRPGRPRGGEAQALRAFFRFLKDRYGRG